MNISCATKEYGWFTWVLYCGIYNTGGSTSFSRVYTPRQALVWALCLGWRLAGKTVAASCIVMNGHCIESFSHEVYAIRTFNLRSL